MYTERLQVSSVMLILYISASTQSAGEVCRQLESYLVPKLQSDNPVVKFKCLRLIRQVVEAGANSEFRRIFQRRSDVVKACSTFRGIADPLKGDSLNKQVRDEAALALKTIFAADPAPLPAPAPHAHGFGAVTQPANYSAANYSPPAWTPPKIPDVPQQVSAFHRFCSAPSSPSDLEIEGFFFSDFQETECTAEALGFLRESAPLTSRLRCMHVILHLWALGRESVIKTLTAAGLFRDLEIAKSAPALRTRAEYLLRVLPGAAPTDLLEMGSKFSFIRK